MTTIKIISVGPNHLPRMAIIDIECPFNNNRCFTISVMDLQTLTGIMNPQVGDVYEMQSAYLVTAAQATVGAPYRWPSAAGPSPTVSLPTPSKDWIAQQASHFNKAFADIAADITKDLAPDAKLSCNCLQPYSHAAWCNAND